MAVSKDFKFRFLLQKAYFDSGFSLTNYIKYLIAFFGLASADVKNTMIIAFIYGISCYFLGRHYITKGWLEQDLEIHNKNNLFVKELRERKV